MNSIFIPNIPKEMAYQIFSDFDSSDLSNCCSLNKECYKFLDDDFWDNFLPKAKAPLGIKAKDFILKYTFGSLAELVERINLCKPLLLNPKVSVSFNCVRLGEILKHTLLNTNTEGYENLYKNVYNRCDFKHVFKTLIYRKENQFNNHFIDYIMEREDLFIDYEFCRIPLFTPHVSCKVITNITRLFNAYNAIQSLNNDNASLVTILEDSWASNNYGCTFEFQDSQLFVEQSIQYITGFGSKTPFPFLKEFSSSQICIARLILDGVAKNDLISGSKFFNVRDFYNKIEGFQDFVVLMNLIGVPQAKKIDEISHELKYIQDNFFGNTTEKVHQIRKQFVTQLQDAYKEKEKNISSFDVKLYSFTAAITPIVIHELVGSSLLGSIAKTALTFCIIGSAINAYNHS